jgi:thioredoxin reductase
MVIDITPDRHLYATSAQYGFMDLHARAIVFAMGCRERTRAQIRLPGCRPAGVYTAGTAQRWVNVEGYMPGKKFVILGSGDIGMIMARRLTFEGAKVERVLEVMPYLTGLSRNYVQCLLDFNIPLQLRHTVKRIIGSDRVQAIESAAVDEHWQFIPGTEEIVPCDTLLLSVGLIPENELSLKAGVALDPVTGGPFVDDGYQTNVPGCFAAGNVVHVYDLVDWVTEAGLVAGKQAAICAQVGATSKGQHPDYVSTEAGENVRYVVPHKVDPATLKTDHVMLQMRVIQPLEHPVSVQIRDENDVIASRSLRYARPGEMVSITLREQHYGRVKNASQLQVHITPR